MTSKFFAHLGQQWAGALALFLVLAGGVAYGANTVFSADIVNGEVKNPDLASNSVTTLKIANSQVRSADVRDDTSSGGGLAAADLSPESVRASEIRFDAVGAEELRETEFFDNGKATTIDPEGGGPTEEVLSDTEGNSGYTIIARCTDSGGGVATAQVIATKDTDDFSGDSTAPGGEDEVLNEPAGGEITLASFGPTTSVKWGVGAYSLIGSPFPLSGVVAVGTHIEGADCAFAVTGTG
jgi:hypothetical protein